MGFFSEAQAVLARDETVFIARLARLDLVEGEVRLWDGFGPAVFGGETWDGAGGFGSVGEIPVGINDTAVSVTMQVSGVEPDFIALAINSESVKGRTATFYAQFLDESLQALGDPFPLPEFVMDVPSYSGSGPTQRTMTVPAESIWTGRNGARFAFFSDRDQQARFPGDRGLVFMSGLKNKKVIWPDF